MIGYLDLPSGLSGDMFLSCLVDAGWPIEALQEVLSHLPLPVGSWSVSAEPVMRGPMRELLSPLKRPKTIITGGCETSER